MIADILLMLPKSKMSFDGHPKSDLKNELKEQSHFISINKNQKNEVNHLGLMSWY
jgi:hypothetical protein